MAQEDYTVTDQDGASHLAELNAIMAAIASNNSGATAPSVTYAYMWWVDTTSGVLKQRNAANSDWITVAKLSNWAMPSVQSQAATAFTTGGSSTAYTLTPDPAIASLSAGQEFDITFHTAAGTTPTLAISGLTAKNLKYRDSTGAKQAVTSTQVPSGWTSKVLYDGTDYVVREIPSASTPLASTATTRTGTSTTEAVSPKGLADTMLGGVGQAWTDVTGSRAASTNYTNSTGRPIMVNANTALAANARLRATVGGVAIADSHVSVTGGAKAYLSFVVPNGATYQIEVPAGTLELWAELR